MGIMNKVVMCILMVLAVAVSLGGFATAVIVDTTAPTITDDYAYDGVWVNFDPIVNLIPFDGESGIHSVRYVVGGPGSVPSSGFFISSPYQLLFSIASENLNTFVRYQAWDVAGNPSEIGQFNVKVDGLVPETTASGVPSGWVNGSVVINLTALDVNFPGAPGSGIKNIYYCIDQNNTCVPTQITTGNVSVSSNGTNYLRFYSEDIAGNIENLQSVTVNISSDTTAPVLTFNDLSTNDNTPTLTGNVDDTSANVSIDFGSGYVPAVNNGDGTWTYQVDVAMIDGEYNISVKAVDGVGNEGSANGTLTIDATAPEVTIESPLNQTYNLGNVSVVVVVNDSNIESVEYSIDGGVTKTALVYNNVTGDYVALIEDLINGVYTLNVYSNDSFGNRNDSQSVGFVVNVTDGDDDDDGDNGGSGGSGGGGGGGGSGGGSGFSSCKENWTSGEWGLCVNGTQARVCNDTNKCGTIVSRPILTRSCTISPAPAEPETVPASEPEQTPFSRITGAIIGTLNSGAGLAALIFIALILGAAIFLRLRK